MSPIPGIVASQISGHLTLPNSYESIATVNASGSSSTITFNSIPGTYKHLQIRGIINVSAASGSVDIGMRFNSDSGSNYSEHYSYGDGSATTSNGGTNLTVVSTFYAYDSSTTQNVSPGIFDILDYANTNKYKTVRGLTGPADVNLIVFRSSNWRSTSAITSITLTSTGTIRSTSQVALYGIKG